MPVCVVLSEVSESSALVRWAVHFAHGEEAELVILDATGRGAEKGSPVADADRIVRVSSRDRVALAAGSSVLQSASIAVEEVCGRVESEGEVWPKIEMWHCRWRCSPNTILRFAKERGTTLLITGQQHRDQPLSGPLFKSAPWRTVLIRLGGSDGRSCREILVPCGGGAHSRDALRIAKGLCAANEGRMHPLFVEPNLDDPEIVHEVGEHILQRNIKSADLGEADSESPSVVPRVVISDDITEGIRSVAGEGTFDLVLIGASNVGTIRQKLFGTVPEHLLRESGNVAVAVVRASRPMAQRLREGAERWLDLRIPQLTRDARVELFEKLQDGSRWSFDFMTLICLSTAIASFGLIQSSAAVVIGAMLVAPLMTPLLGCGLAVMQGNFLLIRSASRAILYGFLSALVIGLVVGCFATELTSEMRARGEPGLLDMGVAFAAGVAASYCLARPKLGAALAGVAIAAALVPPIATIGIALRLMEWKLAGGATLLFATNVVAIVLGAAINFYMAGIRRGWKAAVLGLAGLCGLLGILYGSAVLWSKKPKGLHERIVVILSAPPAENGPVEIEVRRGGIDDAGNAVLEIHVSGPVVPNRDQLAKIADVAQSLSEEPVVVRVRTTLMQEATANSSGANKTE